MKTNKRLKKITFSLSEDVASGERKFSQRISKHVLNMDLREGLNPISANLIVELIHGSESSCDLTREVLDDMSFSDLVELFLTRFNRGGENGER